MAGILDLLLHGALGYGQGRQQLFADRDAKAAADAATARDQANQDRQFQQEQANQDRQYQFELANQQRQDDNQAKQLQFNQDSMKSYGLTEFMKYITSVPTASQPEAVARWNEAYGTAWPVPGSVKTKAQMIPGRAAVPEISEHYVYPGAPGGLGKPSLRYPGAPNIQGPPSVVYPNAPNIQGPPSIVHKRDAIPGMPARRIPEVDYPAYLDPAVAQDRASIAEQYRQGIITPAQLQGSVQAHNTSDRDDWRVPMRSMNFGYKPDILSLLTKAAANHAKMFRGQPMRNFVDTNGHIMQVPDLPVSPEVQSNFDQLGALLRGATPNLPPAPVTFPRANPKKKRSTSVKIGQYRQPLRIPSAPPIPGPGNDRPR